MSWSPGVAPVAVVMISLNEAHNMDAVLDNLKGWAQEVFLVDSYSQDETIDIALSYGVYVVQRRFRDFGDQWNFALRELPVTAPWTMKLDPDERLSEDLKVNLIRHMRSQTSAAAFWRQWWLMGKSLEVGDEVLRVWPTGKCTFSNVSVNEHPIVDGPVQHVSGILEHHDSPDLHHWFEKQNRYSTAEAIIAHRKSGLAADAKFFGSPLERRMWIKRWFFSIPFRYQILFLHYWISKGLWRNGWVGYAGARLWTDSVRFREYKKREIELTGRLPVARTFGPGQPDHRVAQYD
jgi:glycosyltransferase involved in cell wall biosynthesis